MVGTAAEDEDAGDGETVRERLTRVGLAWSVAHFELVMLAVELDESGEWVEDAAPTSCHWIAQALDIELCTAREWLRIGRALLQLPATSAGFEAGVLSFSKVRALHAVATPDTEAELLELAHVTPAGAARRRDPRWMADGEDPEATRARHVAARRFSGRVDVDGMIVGSYRLPPSRASGSSARSTPRSYGHAPAQSRPRSRPTARRRHVVCGPHWRNSGPMPWYDWSAAAGPRRSASSSSTFVATV